MDERLLSLNDVINGGYDTGMMTRSLAFSLIHDMKVRKETWKCFWLLPYSTLPSCDRMWCQYISSHKESHQDSPHMTPTASPGRWDPPGVSPWPLPPWEPWWRQGRVGALVLTRWSEAFLSTQVLSTPLASQDWSAWVLMDERKGFLRSDKKKLVSNLIDLKQFWFCFYISL